MDMRVRYALLAAVWILGVASCAIWGQERTWVAGLGITLVAGATLASVYFTDLAGKDKQRMTVGSIIFLILGLGLLFIGLTNPSS
jgi:hypothetical protein